MLYPLLSEMTAEDYSQSPGLSGTNCATTLTKLFKRDHRKLAIKSATLTMYKIRVKGEKALALVSFATAPEVRQILERRVDGSWKIATLLDTILE